MLAEKASNSAAVAMIAILSMSGCSPAARHASSWGDRIVAADNEPQNWLSYGRNYQETRYSPLGLIDRSNVDRLGLAWAYDLDTSRGQESTPIVVDGVIFTSSAWSKVQAFDGVTGKLLWQFDPHVPGSSGVKACCDVVNRGVAYWAGKVFIGTLDGRLIALDAKSGQPLWSTITVDQSKPYTITGAPRVVKGRVIIGNGGADLGVRGYVSAYDADTGKLDWRFYTVPNGTGKPDGAASDKALARAADTWGPGAPRVGGGGGTAWDSIVYDPELDQLYVGVGNGSGWAQSIRSPKVSGNNDNLFLASVLALNPDTGAYLWHYQETPGDEWDYTSTQPMILADLTIGGQPRKVILHAPKNGFFYVIDRTNGRLISAKPYGEVNWATGVDLATGRPNVVPQAHYSKTGQPWIGKPSSKGDHSWQPMSYDPQTGLVYLPTHMTQQTFMLEKNYKVMPLGANMGISADSFAKTPVDPSLAQARPRTGFLMAWDPVAQKEVWRVSSPTAYNGGLLTTAGGLLFQGDLDGILTAYDVRNGDRLWSFNAQTAVLAPPVTWAKNGVQYVTVVVGWGSGLALGGGPMAWTKDGPRINKSRVLTFMLGGQAKLPASIQSPRAPPPKVAQFADAQTIENGRVAYHRTCFACHGVGAYSGGITPDLRYSGALASPEAWTDIVAKGALADAGMVGFARNFTPDEIEAIRAYVIDRANSTRPPPTAPAPG